jgi:hypothetical protein
MLSMVIIDAADDSADTTVFRCSCSKFNQPTIVPPPRRYLMGHTRLGVLLKGWWSERESVASCKEMSFVR